MMMMTGSNKNTNRNSILLPFSADNKVLLLLLLLIGVPAALLPLQVPFVPSSGSAQLVRAFSSFSSSYDNGGGYDYSSGGRRR